MNSNFIKYLTANSLGSLADGGLFIGIAWLLYNINEKISTVGVYFIIIGLIGFFISPVTGKIVENLNKRNTCIFAYFGKSLITLIISFFIYHGSSSVTIYILLGSLVAICDRVILPAASVMLKELFIGRLLKANSVASIGSQSGYILGASGAGIIISRVNSSFLFLIISIFLLFACISLFLMKYNKNVSSALTVGRDSFLKDLKSTFKYIYFSNMLFYSCILQALLFSALYTINILLAPFCANVIFSGSSGFGYIDSSWGVGAIVGASFSLFISRKPVSLKFLITALLLLALSLIGFSYSVDILTCAILYGAMGAIFVCARVSIETSIQIETPTEILARVRGVVLSINSAVSLIIYTLSSIFIVPSNIRCAYRICSLLIIFTVLYVFILSKKRSILNYSKSQ